VTEGAGSLGLVRESPLPHRIGAGMCQHLDGDVALQARVARAIHLAHAAGSQQADDFIRAEAIGPVRCHANLQVRRQLYADPAAGSIRRIDDDNRTA
jgi:hypothetical protein